MKRGVVVLLSLFFFINTVAAQSQNIKSLVGRWEAVDKDNAGGGIEIVDSSRIFLVFGKDRKPIVSFNADFSKTPAWFDFTIKDTTGNTKFQSLLQVINEDLIQWQLFDGTRPSNFSTAQGEILFLRRKQ
jgi:hypothetical protein